MPGQPLAHLRVLVGWVVVDDGVEARRRRPKQGCPRQKSSTTRTGHRRSSISKRAESEQFAASGTTAAGRYWLTIRPKCDARGPGQKASRSLGEMLRKRLQQQHDAHDEYTFKLNRFCFLETTTAHAIDTKFQTAAATSGGSSFDVAAPHSSMNGITPSDAQKYRLCRSA
jgi:hypothetical protein